MRLLKNVAAKCQFGFCFMLFSSRFHRATNPLPLRIINFSTFKHCSQIFITWFCFSIFSFLTKCRPLLSIFLMILECTHDFSWVIFFVISSDGKFELSYNNDFFCTFNSYDFIHFRIFLCLTWNLCPQFTFQTELKCLS